MQADSPSGLRLGVGAAHGWHVQMQWRHLVAVAHVVSIREQRVQSLRSARLPPPLAPGVKPAAGAIIIIIIIIIIRETY